MTARDWTEGAEAILYDVCRRCSHSIYLRRGFCPACGAEDVETRTAAGGGTVHAVTTVVRAPAPEWKAIAPYDLVLVDLDEGVRMMSHAEPGLKIGDRVSIGWLKFNEQVLPKAQRVTETQP